MSSIYDVQHVEGLSSDVAMFGWWKATGSISAIFV
jgi:hypothetical protein